MTVCINRYSHADGIHALQVFGKGAKFSLYKPAEEMVYISLDNESRTKGKAAIDVVGAQTGKSTGSILQQVRVFARDHALAQAYMPCLWKCIHICMTICKWIHDCMDGLMVL